MYGNDGYTYHFNSVSLEETDKDNIVYGAAVVYWLDSQGVLKNSEMLTYDSAKVFYNE